MYDDQLRHDSKDGHALWMNILNTNMKAFHNSDIRRIVSTTTNVIIDQRAYYDVMLMIHENNVFITFQSSLNIDKLILTNVVPINGPKLDEMLFKHFKYSNYIAELLEDKDVTPSCPPIIAFEPAIPYPKYTAIDNEDKPKRS